MQRYLLLTAVLFGFAGWNACQHAQAGVKPQTHTEMYGNGAVSRRYEEINGKKEGKMVDYFPNGALKAERWFEHDLQTGRTVIYHPGGQIREIQYFTNGKKEGGDTLFYENGRIEFVVAYKQEKKNGYLQKWALDGTLIFEARYVLDSLVEVNGKPVHMNYPAELTGSKGKG